MERLDAEPKESWFANAIAHPLANAALIEPLNAVTSIVNEIRPGTVERVTPFAETPESGISGAVHGVAAGVGSLVPYMLAGKAAGSAFKSSGEALSRLGAIESEGAIAHALSDARLANIAGATLYGAALEPGKGQTRLGDALGSGVAFGTFELGGKLLGKSAPLSLTGVRDRVLVGGAGGALAATSSELTNSYLTDGHATIYDGAGIMRSAFSGAALNGLMPIASDALSKTTLKAEPFPHMSGGESIRVAARDSGTVSEPKIAASDLIGRPESDGSIGYRSLTPLPLHTEGLGIGGLDYTSSNIGRNRSVFETNRGDFAYFPEGSKVSFSQLNRSTTELPFKAVLKNANDSTATYIADGGGKWVVGKNGDKFQTQQFDQSGNLTRQFETPSVTEQNHEPVVRTDDGMSLRNVGSVEHSSSGTTYKSAKLERPTYDSETGELTNAGPGITIDGSSIPGPFDSVELRNDSTRVYQSRVGGELQEFPRGFYAAVDSDTAQFLNADSIKSSAIEEVPNGLILTNSEAAAPWRRAYFDFANHEITTFGANGSELGSRGMSPEFQLTQVFPSDIYPSGVLASPAPLRSVYTGISGKPRYTFASGETLSLEKPSTLGP